MGTYPLQNTLQLPIARRDLAAADTDLARTIASAILESPRPKPDEHGIAPYRELWVSFTQEGAEAPELPPEVDSNSFTQSWISAFSLLSPSESFLQDFQDSFQTALRPLFEPTDYLPQQDTVLYRIVAS